MKKSMDFPRNDTQFEYFENIKCFTQTVCKWAGSRSFCQMFYTKWPWVGWLRVILWAKLQNTRPLQPLHLNKNRNYCYIPRSLKHTGNEV